MIGDKMKDGGPLVALESICRSFESGGGRIDALDGIDLELEAGEVVAIQGASGSGKSTLLQIIGCLDRPTAGSYLYGGRQIDTLSDRELARLRNEEIGFVFQTFHLLADRSALENVSLPLHYRRTREPPRDPRDILERVGLGARLKHRPGKLSGGECQRVAIARALVKRPRLILCDEPTGNLDSRTGADILDLLEELQREQGATLLLVTHDPSVAARAGRVLTLRDGRWEGTGRAAVR